MKTKSNNSVQKGAPKFVFAPKKKSVGKKILISAMWIMTLLPVVVLATLLTLTSTDYFGTLPSFEELENPKSNVATEIYADNGELIGKFFVHNRTHVQYDDLYPENDEECITIDGRKMPPLAAALVATEDARYFDHSGIDLISLARVGVKTIAMQHSSQGGGSTISQQLAKNLFKRKDNIVISKLKEWITALKLEYNYTKEEIISMYLNTVEYGSNTYGIKSASETFFNKIPSELNLQEAALLVGVVNAPTRYSPIRNYDNALERRNLVLQRIKEAGGITQAQCDSLSALPIQLNFKPASHNSGHAPYFREMLRLTMTAEPPVRKNYYTEWDYEQACKEYDENPIVGWCHKNFKADGTPYDIYRDGLKIYTTLNISMQNYAEAAIQKQMQTVIQPNMDKHVGKKGDVFKGVDKKTREKIIKRAMKNSARYQNMKAAKISEEEIEASFKDTCKMRIFTYNGERDTLLTPLDSILHYKRIMRASLVAMEPQTGHVKAYVGGPSFEHFKYDMAKVGKRQVGSTVKPFIYTFAINHLHYTPCTMVPNLPTTIETATGVAWSPKEAAKVEYDGVLHPLRWGLALSRNNYSAWIMKQAKEPQAVADVIHDMGIKSYIDPVPSLCIGSFESNVYEMVSAYSTFANEGVHISPIFVTRIEDKQGNVIATFTPTSQDAISKESAYTMITMMQKVVTSGTASRLIWAHGMKDVDIAGKTGTSNENRDGWFIAITPKLVVGTWLGAEDQNVHITTKFGGSSVALPIVGYFLQDVHKDPNINVNKSDKFVSPPLWVPSECEDAVEPTVSEEVGSTSIEDEFFQ